MELREIVNLKHGFGCGEISSAHEHGRTQHLGFVRRPDQEELPDTPAGHGEAGDEQHEDRLEDASDELPADRRPIESWRRLMEFRVNPRTMTGVVHLGFRLKASDWPGGMLKYVHAPPRTDFARNTICPTCDAVCA